MIPEHYKVGNDEVISISHTGTETIDVIGEGALSRVFRGRFDDKDVAVKMVFKSEYTLLELHLLRTFQHENIVKYLYKDFDTTHMYIVMEKCDCTLQEFIENESRYREKDISLIEILRQTTNGLIYLHDVKDIIHRDLKPSNVLLLLKEKKWVVRIADFGISKQLKPNRSKLTQTNRRGAVGYNAPEVVKKELISKKSDIFSLGILYYFTLSGGEHPFGTDMVMMEGIIRDGKQQPKMELDKKYADDAESLILSMIAHKCEDRFDITQVQSHHIFWKNEKKLNFIQEVSNYAIAKTTSKVISTKLNENSEPVIGKSWRAPVYAESLVIKEVLEEMRFKKHGDDIMNLLRNIRNLKNHFDEKPDKFREWMTKSGSVNNMDFFFKKFPALISHVYKVMRSVERENPIFKDFFNDKKESIPVMQSPARQISSKQDSESIEVVPSKALKRKNSSETPTSSKITKKVASYREDSDSDSESVEVVLPSKAMERQNSSETPIISKITKEPASYQGGVMQPQPQQDNMRLAWDGTLEWTQIREMPQAAQQDHTTHTLSCKVYLRPAQTDKIENIINASLWPTKLTMQLISKMVFNSVRNHMKNNITVSLRMSPEDQMQQLAALMENKWVGLIQIPNQAATQEPTDYKVMIIINSQEHLQFFGVLPLEPQNFLAKIRQVNIASHQRNPEANAIIVFDWKDCHMYSYKPSTKKLSKMQRLPRLQKFSAVVTGEHIYALKNNRIYRLEYSDPASKWNKMRDMNNNHGIRTPAAVLNGFIYVCGGLSNSRSVERYDAARDHWEGICNINIPRRHNCVVATKDDIYCIGGTDSELVERYDQGSNKWEFVEPMPRPVDNASAAFVNNRIYVADDKGVLCYDIQNNSWSEINLSNHWLLVKGGDVKIIAVNEELTIIGRKETDPGLLKNAIYLLEPETEQMTLVEKVDGNFLIHNCLAVSAECLITAEEVLNETQQFQASSELKNQQLTADQSYSSATTSTAQLPITEKANALIMFNWEDEHMYSYKPATNNKEWIKMHKFPHPHRYPEVVFGKHMYTFTDQRMHRLEYSDPAAKFKKMSKLINDHGKNPSAVVLNGFFYVCGGLDYPRSVERYDVAQNRWERKCDMIIARRDPCIVATKDHVYCIGGSDDASVERYDERSNQWDYVKPIPRVVEDGSAAFVNNRIYVADLQGLLCYDIQKNSWSEMNISNQWHFVNGLSLWIVAVNEELYIKGVIIGDFRKKIAIYLLKPETEQMTLVGEFQGANCQFFAGRL